VFSVSVQAAVHFIFLLLLLSVFLPVPYLGSLGLLSIPGLAWLHMASLEAHSAAAAAAAAADPVAHGCPADLRKDCWPGMP
jgi:hypothetical protein